MIVYIVDDDSVSRRAIGITVQRLGYNVKYFTSGRSLVEEGTLGSGLIGHSQKITVAASAMAEKKAVGQRS
jgi:CheY-like chemotaxis protein